MPNFSLRAGFYCKSLKVAQSSGESDGTDVTIPVPLVMEIVSIGRAYTFSYLVNGAERAFPHKSYPVTSARHSYSPNTGVIS